MAQGLLSNYMDPGITSGILSPEDEEWIRKRLEEKKVRERFMPRGKISLPRDRAESSRGEPVGAQVMGGRTGTPPEYWERKTVEGRLPGLAGASRRMPPPMPQGGGGGQYPLAPGSLDALKNTMGAGTPQPMPPPGQMSPPPPPQEPSPPTVPPGQVQGPTLPPAMPPGAMPPPPQKKGLMDMFRNNPKLAQSLLMAGASRPGRRFDIPFGPGESVGPMIRTGLLNYQKLDKEEKAGRATTASALAKQRKEDKDYKFKVGEKLLGQQNADRNYKFKVEKEKREAAESGKGGEKWRKEVKGAYTRRSTAVTVLDRLMKGEDATLTEEMLGENASPMMLTISKMLSGGKPDPATRERAIGMLNKELMWLNTTYDLDLAEQIYEEAGGDKELAKKIARERGYNF